MGFFSWDCKLCGHPLLSEHVLEDKNKWMNKCVALFESGSVIKGSYDGYGRLGDNDVEDQAGEPECYHEACWIISGKPTEFKEESRSSRDQGYFFDPDTHNMPEPKKENIDLIKTTAELGHQVTCDTWTIASLQRLVIIAADGYEAQGALPSFEKRSAFNKIMSELIDYRNKTDENELKKTAEQFGLDVETYQKINKAYLSTFEDPSLKDVKYRFEKVEHLKGPNYRLITTVESYQDINIDTKVVGESSYLD